MHPVKPLIGATVMATHTPTGTVYGTTTRTDGRYDLPNVRIGGPYTIAVSYVGYQTSTQTGFNLKLGEKLPVNFNLSEDAMNLDEVVVTAIGSEVINRDRTGAETNISTEVLEKLPTISRSASDFTRLTPTANGNSFGGRNDQFNNFSLDGSIFNNPFGLDAATPGGQSGAQPISLDAIEQINVSLAPYDVTLAGFTGASVNAVTKSGTNEFHGTVFGFFRNDDMTGSKVDGDDIVVPDLEQLQAGFSVGGPLIKNKLFFFANFELDNREDLGTTFVANRPGLTGENVSRVEAADLELVSDALRSRGYETGPYEGYIHNTESTKGLFKLDFNINQNHTLTATYNFLDAFRDKPAHPTAIGNRGPDFNILQFYNSGYRINNVIHSGIIELRSLFGNKMANKFQAGYTKFKDSRDPFSEAAPVINILRDGGRYIIAGHEPFSINNRLDQDVFQITNNFNYYAGKHTITAGVSLERFDFDNSFNLGVYDAFPHLVIGGTFSNGYPSVQEFVDLVNAGDFDDELAFAKSVFEANGGDDGTLGEGWALAETNVGQFAIYLQDEIEINDQFTLTAGLRMDMPLYFNTEDKIRENIERVGGNAPDVRWYDEDGNTVQFTHTDLPDQKPLWSPRIGFNYDVKGDKTMQLRGGSGLFSGRLPFVWIGNQVANPGAGFYNVTDKDFKFPQVWRSNLGYDVKLKGGWTFTTDLIYTKDINAAMVRNYSLKPPTGTLNAPGDNRPIYTETDHAEDLAGLPGVFGPPYGTGYVFGNTDIGYTFNASIQVQKAFANGLNLMLAYNFLDAEDATSIEAEISSDAFAANPIIGNANVPVASKSLYGSRHRVIGSAYKTFRYGENDKWATTISTFFEFAQGGTTVSDFTADYRFSYTYSSDLNGDGSPINDLLYIPTDSELDQMNFASDAQREAFRDFIEQDDYLSGRRGQYAEKYATLAPWYSNWDVRVLQDFNFDVNGRMNTIQFSLDILNFGNLISSSWNVKQLPRNNRPVGISGFDDSGRPTYTFDTGLRSSFVNDFSLDTRWQMRLGLRYIF